MFKCFLTATKIGDTINSERAFSVAIATANGILSSKVYFKSLLGATSGKFNNLPKFSTRVKSNLVKTASKLNLL